MGFKRLFALFAEKNQRGVFSKGPRRVEAYNRRSDTSSFLQRQLWIFNYYLKSLSENLSYRNKHL